MSSPSRPSAKDTGWSFSDEWQRFGYLIGLGTTAYYMYVAVFGTFSPPLDRSLFIFSGVAITICQYPLARNTAARLVDSMLLLAVAAATIRFNQNYMTFAENEGFPIGDFDMAMGWIMIVAVIEAGRRVLGMSMAVISIAFLLFLYLGNHVPWPLTHGGFNLRLISTALYAQTDGIYGSITSVLASTLFLIPRVRHLLDPQRSL